MSRASEAHDRSSEAHNAAERTRAAGVLCSFCPEPALARCTWRSLMPQPKPIRLAEIGDVWITQVAAKRGRIVQIDYLNMWMKPCEILSAGFVKVWVKLPPPGHPTPYPYIRGYGHGAFMTERMRNCQQAACEFHMRDLDGGYVCQEH